MISKTAADGSAGAAPFRCGFVAILGAPNAGKSTLLNRMVGYKVSITSRKPQTTRERIIGVLTTESAQLIFLDTPGIHHSHSSFNRRIVEGALSAISDSDVNLLLLDGVRSDPEAEAMLLAALAKHPKPTVLALNKIDRIDRSTVLSLLCLWQQRFSFKAMVPISAAKGTQIDTLQAVLASALPACPPLFAPDSITDRSQRFLAAELIREQVFRQTGGEIPYAVAVSIESFAGENGPGIVRIDGTIHVERPSQKGILIGRKGAKLKQIGSAARSQIEHMLGRQIFLRLFVRVQKNWSKDSNALDKFGY